MHSFFFFRYTFNVCNGRRQQGQITIYFNLLSHWIMKHPDYLTGMDTVHCYENRSIELIGFASKSVAPMYCRMRWKVVRNLALCESDDLLTRFMSLIRLATSRTVNANMHLVSKGIDEKWGKRLVSFLMGGHTARLSISRCLSATCRRHVSLTAVLFFAARRRSLAADIQVDHFMRMRDLSSKTHRFHLCR